jgi:WD40 repeat protein/GTPase SAR1 family protein
MAEQNQEEQWRRADEEVRKNLPPGVKLVRTLRGHTDWIGRIAWSADGRMLASPSADKTIRIWDAETGECLRTLKGHKGSVYCVAFDQASRTLASGGQDRTVKLWTTASGQLFRMMDGHENQIHYLAFDPQGGTLASASYDGTAKIWEVATGRLLRTLEGHRSIVHSVSFDRTGRTLASGNDDGTVKMWDARGGHLLRTLKGHKNMVCSVAFDPTGRTLASGSEDRTVNLWDASIGHLARTLEDHTDGVRSVAFLSDGRILASKGQDNTIRLWSMHPSACLAVIPAQAGFFVFPSLAFHPQLPLLATVGSDPGTPEDDRDRVIHIYELDIAILLGQMAEPSAHYVNAKVVLVGDTGVGKTGLSLVLNKQPFEATDSTPGRKVWTFDSREVDVGGNVTQTRETLLWDLAGQPGYRVIHQLHLSEVAVALVVFDARSETDPLAGVRHWERALRLAQQRQGASGVPMKKFLVSARNDRGGVSIGEERLQAVLKEFGFESYFKTSAKEGWQVKELRAAIEQAISWENLPEVSSSQLFADIKSFLLEVKKTGLLLAPAGQLYDEFARQHPDTARLCRN